MALGVLKGFHVEATRRITGMRPQNRGTTWVYPKSAKVLRAARLRTVREYVAMRRQTAAALVVNRPVLKECRRTERRHGTATRSMWWDQDVDWEVAYEAAANNARGPDENLDLE